MMTDAIELAKAVYSECDDIAGFPSDAEIKIAVRNRIANAIRAAQRDAWNEAIEAAAKLCLEHADGRYKYPSDHVLQNMAENIRALKLEAK